MKRTLTFLSVFALVLLFGSSANAQIRTVRGDFFNIVRTIEQTADSVTFVADTLTFADNSGNINDFNNNDSVAVMFVQNRFKIVNNMLTQTLFDYIRVRVASSSPGMTLAHQGYNGVITNTQLPPLNEAATSGRDLGIRPVYRNVGDIASSSPFNSDPAAIRQILSFRIQNPTGNGDVIQMRNIFFKPNINNLTGLAVPPDTTKDTLRAYLLDGSSGNPSAYGNVIPSGQFSGGTDLAIVRLLPGTSRLLVWVSDSAQAVDAGEYIGSFGDYSRGRYFLGDDGLPFDATNTSHQAFRPGPTRTLGMTTVQNPDYGMMVDGLPPERNPLRLSNLYQALAPAAYTQGAWYNALNPNPVNGLIPPYRAGESNVASNPYQPGLVSSAIDTLRFLDAYGNRTWDRMTQPKLKALAYTIQNVAPEDRTVYLKGATAADDTLRQFGQIVYRRLAYTHADVGVNPGGVEDSVRIYAYADIQYTDPGGISRNIAAVGDTSGGFPREYLTGIMPNAVRAQEAYLDMQSGVANNGRTNGSMWYPDGSDSNPMGYRFPVDPMGVNSLPPTGSKIVVRPNIPRAIDIMPTDQWKGTADNNYLRLDILVADGFGNTVDDNEKFKFELSPFGMMANGLKYRLNGIFDSLVNPISPIVVTGGNIDSGRVFVGTSNLGRNNRVFRAASGSNNIGPYRIRVRSTYAFNDRGNDVTDPNKLDVNPGTGFAHVNFIPDGSPNNNFGIWFGPGTGYNANLGKKVGQTTAMDSTDVVWDGVNWTYFQGRQPRVELVIGRDEAFVVGRVGNYRNPIFDKLYIRLTDIFGNPMDIAPYFYPNTNKVFVELPDNQQYWPATTGAKRFYASVSANVALSGANGRDNPENVTDPNTGSLLEAELVNVAAGTALPGIPGDIPVAYNYNAVRFFLRAPQNVTKLSLAGTDVVRLRAHLQLQTIPGVGDFSIQSAIGEVSVIPDVVSTVEIFKSTGKPAGASVPLGNWGPGTVADRTAALFPTGTPVDAAESNEFYKGYFFRSTGADVPPSTAQDFPSVFEPMGYSDQGIGSFQASGVDLDHDATAPIPMDTIVVSEHNKQVRIVARLLDRFQNPVGGRLTKFFVESETVPVTPPKTQLQSTTQRGGFGEFGQVFITDDTLKRSTIGDTAQAGWVSAYFVSGRVGWQIVRIAMTPDTLAFDLTDKGRNLGEGTAVGPSMRGFAPRVIIPIYQKSDTTVRVEIFPYTAAATSPIPLPVDLVKLQVLEHHSVYADAGASFGQINNYAPKFHAYSANPLAQEDRATHFNVVANTNIRPYIPDTLGLTVNDPTNVDAVTAGRTVTLLVREYDRFGNLVDNFTEFEDTARVRFRMWGENWSAPPQPYTAGGAGTIAPALDWTRDEYGPMRKARYRHTKVGNLVSGVHINQTSFFNALELPTPKLANATMFIEATATAVLPGQGPTNIHRDTVKVVSVLKDPTRFDILRAGQDFAALGPGLGTVGLFELQGPPEDRLPSTVRNIGLPPGADVNQHGLTDQGVDNILISQVYKRNVSPKPVGKYEVVNDDNVPLDKDGDPLYTATGDVNPDFERDPHSGLPVFVKLDAYNNLNPQTSPNDRYNDLNNGGSQYTVPSGARRDGTIFDITIAGGGDGIGTGGVTQNWDPQGNQYDDRRPVLMRVTPVWENDPPMGGNAYVVAGQSREYGRLYADTIYTYTGTLSPLKTGATRAELMGTRTDLGEPGFYKPTGEGDRITRVSIGAWQPSDYFRAGLPHRPVNGQLPPLNTFRTRFGVGMSGGSTATGDVFGDFNRRVALLGSAFGREISVAGNSSLTFAPGAFLRIVDSTAEQVVDLRVVDPTLQDMAGNTVDDTLSYDHAKMTVVRRSNRLNPFNPLFHLDDTYYDLNIADIQGPNLNVDRIGELPLQRTNRATHGLMAAAVRQFFGPARYSRLRHTFVVVPYRIAYTSIFPSSYDITANTFDKSTLPVGILPVQADIDTLPRVSPMFYADPYGTPINEFEIFSRLYGQIAHGATTDQIPNNVGTPYARPDTIFRDEWYTYAVTPYDRYGNLNMRDTMYVNLGTRHTTWEFTNVSAMGASGNLEIAGGGRYFSAKPVGFPQNTNLRQDSLILYNLSLVSAGNRNDFVGMKPDDKRLGTAVGDRAGVAIRDGILPANAIAVRPVNIKKPFAPGAFTLSAPTLQNTALFRMDHTGNCTDTSGQAVDGTAMDMLRLQWGEATWSDPAYNNPNDTIRYEWYGIIDSVGTMGNKTLTVSILADDEGRKPSLTLSGDKVRELLFRPNMLPQPNQDSLVMRVKWFVRAFSKIAGLETYSDTAGVSVRNTPNSPVTPPLVISINRLPDNPPTAVQPPDGGTEFVDGTAPLSVLWSAASDINNRKGDDLDGAPNPAGDPGPFMVYNPTTRVWELDPARTIDTLSYQFVGRVVSTFPVGKGAPIGTMLVINAGASTGIQIPTTDLDALFAGFSSDPASTSADSVKIEWFVYTKDFNVNDDLPLEQVEFPFVPGIHVNPDSTALNGDTSRWSPTSCQPHWIVSGPFRLNLTKLKGGGVEIDPIAGDPDINAKVGEEVCFTLTARDENGNIIRDWDSPSQNNPATELTLNGSFANTDTSTVSWNADPDGYTYALISQDGTALTQINDSTWSIPASAFTDGVATICLVHTKSDKGVTIEVSPVVANLNQTSATMNFDADEITNYLVDLTGAPNETDDDVYLLRRYEIVVSPRDRFLNVVDGETIRTDFTARFPGEFDQNQPGLSDIFAGSVFIKGTTNYFLASRIKRLDADMDERQWVEAYASSDNMIKGRTNPYQVLNHAPYEFALQEPADNTELKLQAAAIQQEFNWVKASPQDPYNNIQVSRFNINDVQSDVVTYKIKFLDGVSLTRAQVFESDDNGMEATFTSNHGQLAGLIDVISGIPTTKELEIVWYVEATDGLYITKSTPPTNDPRDGFHLKLVKEGILDINPGVAPASYSLGQNYPNPFNPTTTISYDMSKSGQVNLEVYDLLGNKIKTLVNDNMAAGSYQVMWDATNDMGVQVPSGNYLIKMVAGDFVKTRKMTLMK
ncbi:T9SS type A sorting domain-containing protein [bacterium]|nr:T9SS type A sorting domain-containing protein [bacterium]